MRTFGMTAQETNSGCADPLCLPSTSNLCTGCSIDFTFGLTSVCMPLVMTLHHIATMRKPVSRMGPKRLQRTSMWQACCQSAKSVGRHALVKYAMLAPRQSDEARDVRLT